MRDTKSLLLLLVSLLLVLVSFVLIWTWGYNFYAKNDIQKPVKVSSKTDSATIANQVRDSLQKEYNATLQNLDMQLDSSLIYSDSLKTQLDVKLAEFYRLRDEIALILKTRNNNNNFTVAKLKLSELQTKVEDLKTKNQDVDTENKKLNEVLNQIKGSEKNPDRNIQPPVMVKNNATERSNPAVSAFTVSELRLSAIMNANEIETETMEAEKTGRIAGSFAVVNFNSQLSNAEIVVVVLKPDGRVLKGSSWDSGTFNTPDGKKIYSYKFNFTSSRGEPKRLNFSLKGSNLTRGNYTMEVYHNGLLIGKTVKSLS